MKRLLLLPLLLVAVACPKDKKTVDTTRIPVDTTPADLSGISADLPPAAPDTFKPAKVPDQPAGASAPSYPAAPDALMEAITREQSATRFCYNEFGLKNDPNLRGNVTLLVTVGRSGITDARVGNSIWSPAAGGRAVNNCLNEKAKDAFKIAQGSVKPGTYRVPLSFATR
jgi:outer membrane biosynthesis protein TonB